MAQKWLEHSLGRGVVLTRQDTALRDGELQSASFVRMLPGNSQQLYPDRDYDRFRLNLRATDEVVDSFFMNFEGNLNFLVVIMTPSDRTSFDTSTYHVFDLNNLVEGSKGLTAILIGSALANVTSATLVNRGAEYFMNIASSIPDTPVFLSAIQKIFFINSSNVLAIREVGLSPSNLTLQTTRSIPELAATVWTREQQSGADALYPSTAYTATILVQNHLYGSFANALTEWATPAERRDAWKDGFDQLRAIGVDLSSFEFDELFAIKEMARGFVPVSRISLRLEGQGFVFGYWCTEVDESTAVESGPSSIVTAVSGDPQTAVWEVEINWLAFIETGSPYWAEFVDYVVDNVNLFSVSPLFFTEAGVRAFMDAVLAEFGKAYSIGTLEQFRVGRFPLSKAQEEALVNRIDIDNQSNSQATEVRLYRQNLGVFNDYFLEWQPDAISAQLSEPVGEGPRNAEDLIAGRITRQGGLLKVFPQTDLPTTIDDNLLQSGVSDPGLAFPTINYVNRGGLGVFDYLRRPVGSSACANMAQSLLRVEHSSQTDTLDRNLIAVSPVEDPEQSPLIYAIPIVTERQDEIIDLRTIRDTALVFTTTSVLHLNYIPFEGSNQQDRVLTQVTSNHGVADNRRGALVETNSGQILVWLSQTSLMASNGLGAWDMCPDFSVERAEALGFDFSRPLLVNNAAEHRLELWTGGVRWDFLYHRSHLKDIRGDGAGLSLKLMGPTPWYDDATARKGGVVRSVCSGVLDDKFRTFHTFEKSSGGKVLAISNDTNVTQASIVQTRKLWGSDPTSIIRSKRMGVQHGRDLKSLKIGVISTSPATQSAGSGSRDNKRPPLDFDLGFSDRFVLDGLGSSGTYTVEWDGGAVGPLWVQTVEAPGGSGR